MLYDNYTNDALSELERQRTNTYGMNDDYNYIPAECCICSDTHGELYAVNDHHLCKDCICNILRDSFENAIISDPDNIIDAKEIFQDIISDFSDNEIMTYVENKYDMIN